MNGFKTHSNFQIKRKISQGGFGTVFEAFNKDDNKIYAIKQIPINKKNTSELEQMKNEAKILSNINNEFIVRYYDSFLENDCFIANRLNIF